MFVDVANSYSWVTWASYTDNNPKVSPFIICCQLFSNISDSREDSDRHRYRKSWLTCIYSMFINIWVVVLCRAYLMWDFFLFMYNRASKEGKQCHVSTVEGIWNKSHFCAVWLLALVNIQKQLTLSYESRSVWL